MFLTVIADLCHVVLILAQSEYICHEVVETCPRAGRVNRYPAARQTT